MTTMTEEEIVEKYGPIRYYEIRIVKSFPNVLRRWHNDGKGYTEEPRLGRCGRHAQTIKCYSREELDTTLDEVKAKAPSMSRTRALGMQEHRADKVFVSVWGAPRGYDKFKRHAGSSSIPDLRPIFRKEFQCTS